MAELLGPDEIDIAAACLADGGLVAFPTETVYGLGADAGRAEAVAGIFEAKGRPSGHPLIVHLATAADIDRFGHRVPPLAYKLADAFWPGPLTLVVERSDLVAAETVGGLDTVGLRMPDHPVALELLRRFDGAVAAPSANRFGSVSPTTAQHVIDDLGPLIDYVIDGGPSAVGVESTIVDLTGPAPLLLRPGGIATVELEAVLGLPVDDGRSGPARASGMLASHYAPAAAIELVTVDEVEPALVAAAAVTDGAVGLMTHRDVGHEPTWLMPADADAYAARLFTTLRAADRAGVTRLLVVAPVEGRLLDAVLDRLDKAAAPRPSSEPG